LTWRLRAFALEVSAEVAVGVPRNYTNVHIHVAPRQGRGLRPNLSDNPSFFPPIFTRPYGRSKSPKLPILSFVVIFPILSIYRVARVLLNANAKSIGEKLRHAAQTKTDLEFG
jgi:hypothetical protein